MLTRAFHYHEALPTTTGIEEEPAATPASDVVRKMLCKPVSYDKTQNIICARRFVQEQTTISLRLLCLSTDLSVIHNWLPMEYTGLIKKEAHIDQLRDLYRQIAASGTAQSFMILMNNVILAQADVFSAFVDDIAFQYSVNKGDFKLQLLVKPDKLLINNYSSCALIATMELLFSFEEVKRLVMALDENEYLNSKVLSAGFVFEKEFTRRQKIFRLYTCTKEDFYRSL